MATDARFFIGLSARSRDRIHQWADNATDAARDLERAGSDPVAQAYAEGARDALRAVLGATPKARILPVITLAES